MCLTKSNIVLNENQTIIGFESQSNLRDRYSLKQLVGPLPNMTTWDTRMNTNSLFTIIIMSQ